MVRSLPAFGQASLATFRQSILQFRAGVRPDQMKSGQTEIQPTRNPPARFPGPLMTSALTPSTTRASFAIGSEQTAKRVVDLLNESFFEGQAAIAAYEGPGGRWDISVHFAEPPDQASIRELV